MVEVVHSVLIMRRNVVIFCRFKVRLPTLNASFAVCVPSCYYDNVCRCFLRLWKNSFSENARRSAIVCLGGPGQGPSVRGLPPAPPLP